MKVIKTIKDKILFAYQLVAAITLVVLIAAAAIQVVTRYVIAQPPGWTDELARFAFVWCSALGAVVALDKGMHAGITLLEEKLPEAGRRVLKIICTILEEYQIITEQAANGKEAVQCMEHSESGRAVGAFPDIRCKPRRNKHYTEHLQRRTAGNTGWHPGRCFSISR